MESETEMETLSTQIYNALSNKDVCINPKHRHRAMWTWSILLRRQSVQTLQSLLQQLEEAANNDRLEDQQLLELGWKAETLELLLSQYEQERVPEPAPV
jgi:hypothetical protein